MAKRVVMRVDLQRSPGANSPEVRSFLSGDRQQLGVLLFNAYVGTIDQEEETLEQAQSEIDKTIDGHYGTFLPSASMVVERHGILYSAALLTRFHDRPFVAFSITRPESKNQGFARACINSAMRELARTGEHELHLVVTLANAPAFHLYTSLGFEVERDV